MLFLVATPIGNLQDITFRAVETLKTVDYILCEDTRHSKTLLNHYNIDTHLKSYHKFNEAKTEDAIISHLKEGKKIALISDAGTPGISDPGTRLVTRCVAEGITVIPIPGPCAAIAAISASGFPTNHFQFWGFLPKKLGELTKTLQEMLRYQHATICYESAERLPKVLKLLSELDATRQLVIARELTKRFEEIKHGTAEQLLSHSYKGEIVLIISGSTESSLDWSHLTPEEHVAELQDTYAISKKEAIKIVASLRNLCKRTLYKSSYT